MVLLREYLTDKGIEWIDKSTLGMCEIHRTHFYIKDIFYSAINGCGTYGGFYFFQPPCANQGLIELMIGGNEPIGFLTAKDVIEMIEKELNNE